MSDDEIISKFRANAGEVLERKIQDKVIDLTWHFEDIEDMGDYLGLLR
jgi:hypothetical protein